MPAKQLEFFQIPSPCIGVCESDANGRCMGCFRSRDERLYWNKLDDDTKRQICRACVMRKRRAEIAAHHKADPDDGPDQGDLFT